MTSALKNTSCVILVGGESKRMNGRDKAQTTLKGKTLLRHVFDIVEDIFNDIMVSAHDEGYTTELGNTKKPRLITDTLSGRGPALGIAEALKEAKNEWVFALACDQPMIDKRVIDYMAGFLNEEHDIIVPTSNGNLQTLFAFYKKTCLTPLMERLNGKTPRRSLKGFIEDTGTLNIRYVTEEEIQKIDSDLLSFMDVDTPEDLRRIEGILRKD